LVHISESASFFSPAYFLHAAFSGISMVAMMFVPLLLACQAALKQQKVLSLFYSVCLIGSILALLLFAAYYLPVIGRWLSSTRGFWQRLSLFFLYLPALSIAFRQLAKKN
jgi:CBS domain containing-hemolysin-like protein